MPLSSNTTRSIRNPARAPDLLIAGASARAAAFSAVRGGLRVATADLFADADLREFADATRVSDWPNKVFDWMRNFPTTVPFVYVGGLENAPDLIARVSQNRVVAGITGVLLEHLRRPQFVADLCEHHGFPYPRLFPSDAHGSHSLLVKPLHSVAGLGIRRADDRAAGTNEYVQEFIAGTAISAAYLITDRNSELLGTCQQISSGPSNSAALFPFLYRGSITQALPHRHRIGQFGGILHGLGVRGLCGVDFIQPPDGDPVILEINPRYTASMELIELQSGRSLILEHLKAFGHLFAGRDINSACPRPPQLHRGKRIVFAPQHLCWRAPSPEILPPLPDGTRSIADLPYEGARICAGAPICTLFVVGESFDDCHEELITRELRLLDYLESVANGN